MGQALPVCPVCGRETHRRAPGQALPFCSPKCKLVDLGRWLEGSYRVPGPRVSPGEGEARLLSDEEDE